MRGVRSISISSALLRKLPLFSELPLEDLQFVSSIVRTRCVNEGELLFAEAEPGLGVWFVLEGAVRLVKTDPLGREQLLKVVMPQEFFAEVVLFDGGSYPATAIAAMEGSVAIIYNADALLLVQSHPTLAWHFLRVLSARLRLAQERNRILSAGAASAKVAATLLLLSQEQGQDSIPLGQQDIADMAGLARETVSRVLVSFAKKGLISLRRKNITLVEKKQLAFYALEQ